MGDNDDDLDLDMELASGEERHPHLEVLMGLTSLLGATLGMLRLRGGLTADEVNTARSLALEASQRMGLEHAERFINMAVDFSHSFRGPDTPPKGTRRR